MQDERPGLSRHLDMGLRIQLSFDGACQLDVRAPPRRCSKSGTESQSTWTGQPLKVPTVLSIVVTPLKSFQDRRVDASQFVDAPRALRETGLAMINANEKLGPAKRAVAQANQEFAQRPQ